MTNKTIDNKCEHREIGTSVMAICKDKEQYNKCPQWIQTCDYQARYGSNSFCTYYPKATLRKK